jgi:hypothetical protein
MRSGATFEVEKTAIIHFTRKTYKSDTEPFAIRGRLIRPKTQVKVLGVIMDTGLKYEDHIARAATKGLRAAMELQRLRGLEVQVMETRKTKLGADHPDTLISMGNLAHTYWSQDRRLKAVDLMRRCVRAQKEKLGSGHPDY